MSERYRSELVPVSPEPDSAPPITKRCPRCGASFRCFHADIAQCPCRRVELSAELTAALAGRYGDCLCSDCLQALAAEDAALRDTTATC